jgi:hypothetical protein
MILSRKSNLELDWDNPFDGDEAVTMIREYVKRQERNGNHLRFRPLITKKIFKLPALAQQGFTGRNDARVINANVINRGRGQLV